MLSDTPEISLGSFYVYLYLVDLIGNHMRWNTRDPLLRVCFTGVRCQSGQFQCATGGQCISVLRRCDEYPDCSDGSDELNCRE